MHEIYLHGGHTSAFPIRKWFELLFLSNYAPLIYTFLDLSWALRKTNKVAVGEIRHKLPSVPTFRERYISCTLKSEV